MEDGITIGEITKNETDVLRISVKEYKGHKYIDVRKYFKNGSGKMIPDKLGVTVGKKSINEFINYLRDARSVLNGEEAF